MRLKTVSYDDLNTLNAKQLRSILRREVPQVNRFVRQIERNLGTSQAVKSIQEMYPKGLASDYEIRYELTFHQLKEMAYEVRKFRQMETSTVSGARSSLDKILLRSGVNRDVLSNTRKKLGGYKGITDFLNKVDEIRALVPSLEFVPGSDGSPMESMLKAYMENDKRSIEELAERAKELYYDVTTRKNQENEYFSSLFFD